MSASTLFLLLVLLACPLMMVFMMRGMSHGGMNHRGEEQGNQHEHSHTGPTGRDEP